MRYSEILLERNILNIDEITRFVDEMARRAHNPAVQKWLLTMLPAFLKKNYDRLRNVQKGDLSKYFPQGEPSWAAKAISDNDLHTVVIDHQLRDDVMQTIDFLESDANPNLARLPFAQALKMSKAWHEALAKQSAPTSFNQEGVVPVKKYPDGYTWVMLTTPACLDAEGKVMQNCVGGGAYDSRVSSGHTTIFSLRDHKGESHVTAAISNEVDEIKGKQNKPPIAKYRPYVIDLLNTLVAKGTINKEQTSDLEAMSIFAGKKGFGSLFDVSTKVIDCPSGNKLAFLSAGGRNMQYCYLATPSASTIAIIYISASAIMDVTIRDKKAKPKDDIVWILRNVLGNFKVADFSRTELAHFFGLDFSGKDAASVKDMAENSSFHLIKSDLLYRLYTSGSPYNKQRTVLLYDSGNNLLIYMDIHQVSDHFEIARHNINTADWSEAAGLLLEGLKQLNVTLNGRDRRMFIQQGLLPSEGGWIRDAKLFEKAKIVYKTDRDHTWHHDGKYLWLNVNGHAKAGLVVKDVVEDEQETVYQISNVVRAFHDIDLDIRLDVEALFLMGLAEIYDARYYRGGDLFLMHYDVWSDGYEVRAIDWDVGVTYEVEVENVEGDIISENSTEMSLGEAVSNLGFDDDAYTYSIVFEDVVYNKSTYEYETEFGNSDFEDDVLTSYYKDANAYRVEHNLGPDDDLPYPSREIFRITLAK